MKERPILFSAPMVRAILAGTKSQTRRVVKGRALEWLSSSGFTPKFTADPDNGLSPYGQPGEILWVREAWNSNGLNWRNPIRDMRKGLGPIHYAATDQGEWESYWGKWKPSIHMPRWASRITLEIIRVRVERLQDISEADAKAEGAPFELGALESTILGARAKYRSGFCRLWEQINGHGSWEANPWVWVLEFRRVKGGAA